MNDNARHVLPPLADNHKVQAVSGTGEWESIGDSEALETIANFLMAEANPSTSSVVSIPDPWAHVETFAAALFDEHAEQNSHAVGEWRGLLALIALTPYYRYRLSSHHIQLAPPPGREEATRDLLGVLHASLPVAVFADDLTWDSLSAIRIDDRLVGLICPSTLVVPSRNYRSSLPPNLVPWARTGGIVDPLAVEDLHIEHLQTLSRYVKGLTEVVENQNHGKRRRGPATVTERARDVADSLLRVLRSYSADIQEKLDEIGDDANTYLVPFPIRLELPGHAAYAALADVSIVKSSDHHRFDVALPARAPIADLLKGALIYDPKIDRGIGRKAADVIVWNRASVEGLTRECPTPARLREHAIVEEATLAGYVLLTAEDIFLPCLCRVKETRRARFHGQMLGEYLLPYNPAMLLFLTAEQLRDSTRIERTGQGIAVTLSMALRSSPTDRPATRVTLRQEYLEPVSSPGRAAEIDGEPQKGIIIEADWPETVALWPNFSHPDWQWNFVFSSANPQLRYTVQSTIALDGLGEALRKLPDFRQRADVVRGWVKQPPTAGKRLAIREMSLVATDLFLMPHAPEAMALWQTTKSDSGTIPFDQRRPAGLLLLGRLEEPPIGNERLTVGIDFGTSNTCIYSRRGNDSPRAVTFRNRIVSPFGELTTPERGALSDFIQAADIDVPFQSVLKDRGVAPEDDDTPVSTDHIYFVENIAKGLSEALGNTGGGEGAVGRAARLVANLKWSNDEAQRQQVRRFIGQAAIMTAAEALAAGVPVDRIEWRFSYPEAFDPTRFHRYMSLYAAGARFALGPRGPLRQDQPEPRHLSESIAAAYYFSARPKLKAYFTETVVTIDIGGHTSDISIWQNQALLWRGSVELAGRHVVSAALAADLKLLGSLAKGIFKPEVKPDPIDTLRNVQEMDRRRFAVEVLLNYREFATNMFGKIDVVDQAAVDRLMLLAEFVLAALLYHIGHQIRALAAGGRFDTGRRGIKIFLGGRTSQIFPQLFGKEPSALSGTLRMLQEASGIAELTAQIDYSDLPKHEVAYGLVMDDMNEPGKLTTKGHLVDVVMGEEIVADGKAYGPEERIGTIPRQAGMRLGKLVGFDLFLENLRQLCGIRVRIEERVRSDMIGQVNGELDRAVRARRAAAPDEHEAQGDTTSLESPFLMVVRQAVAAIIDGHIELTRTR